MGMVLRNPEVLRGLIYPRRARVMSTQQLADESGVSRSMISHLICGTYAVSEDNAQRISKALGMNTLTLFIQDGVMLR